VLRERTLAPPLCWALLFLLFAACSGPSVLSPYRSFYKPGGAPRGGAHPAIDFGGTIGDPVLAPADGKVVAVYRDGPGQACGHGLRVWHEKFDKYTLYCQLHSVKVGLGEGVKRGQVIALLGDSGEPSWSPRPIPMLHFELSDYVLYRGDGDLQGTHDPMKFIVGCFDAKKSYPEERLALTYPVACRD